MDDPNADRLTPKEIVKIRMKFDEAEIIVKKLLT
jgi:hypothetical protein